MRHTLTRPFWWHIAALLFAACLVIFSVLMTVECSVGVGFLETAARTEVLLTVISYLLAFSILTFTLFVMFRRRA
jgi:hypothetical protein